MYASLLPRAVRRSMRPTWGHHGWADVEDHPLGVRAELRERTPEPRRVGLVPVVRGDLVDRDQPALRAGGQLGADRGGDLVGGHRRERDAPQLAHLALERPARVGVDRHLPNGVHQPRKAGAAVVDRVRRQGGRVDDAEPRRRLRCPSLRAGPPARPGRRSPPASCPCAGPRSRPSVPPDHGRHESRRRGRPKAQEGENLDVALRRWHAHAPGRLARRCEAGGDTG